MLPLISLLPILLVRALSKELSFPWIFRPAHQIVPCYRTLRSKICWQHHFKHHISTRQKLIKHAAEIFCHISSGDRFKGSAFKKVADIINSYDEKITSGKQLSHVKGVGKGSIAKVRAGHANADLMLLPGDRLSTICLQSSAKSFGFNIQPTGSAQCSERRARRGR